MSESFVKVFEFIILTSLVGNFVFVRFLGLGVFFLPLLKPGRVLGAGAMFIGVMMAVAAVCWGVMTYVLRPLHCSYLMIVVYCGVVAGFMFVAAYLFRKSVPLLREQLIKNSSLFVILNTVLLAVPLLTTQAGYSLSKTILFGFGSGLGLILALLMAMSIRERLDSAGVPEPFRGAPLAIIAAAMIAIALSGLAGIVPLH